MAAWNNHHQESGRDIYNNQANRDINNNNKYVKFQCSHPNTTTPPTSRNRAPNPSDQLSLWINKAFVDTEEATFVNTRLKMALKLIWVYLTSKQCKNVQDQFPKLRSSRAKISLCKSLLLRIGYQYKKEKWTVWRPIMKTYNKEMKKYKNAILPRTTNVSLLSFIAGLTINQINPPDRFQVTISNISAKITPNELQVVVEALSGVNIEHIFKCNSTCAVLYVANEIEQRKVCDKLENETEYKVAVDSDEANMHIKNEHKYIAILSGLCETTGVDKLKILIKHLCDLNYDTFKLKANGLYEMIVECQDKNDVETIQDKLDKITVDGRVIEVVVVGDRSDRSGRNKKRKTKRDKRQKSRSRSRDRKDRKNRKDRKHRDRNGRGSRDRDRDRDNVYNNNRSGRGYRYESYDDRRYNYNQNRHHYYNDKW